MAKYQIKKGIIKDKIDGKTVIFDGEASVLVNFNDTASEIFEALKKGKNEKDIYLTLSKKYQIPINKAKKDADKLILQLKKSKIIKKIS